MIKNTIIGAVTAIVIVFGAFALNSTSNYSVSVGPQGPQGVQGERGRDGVDGVTKVVTQVVNEPKVSLGAVSSPDVQSPYLTFGGLRRWAGKTDSLVQATTTVCAIQSPTSTSTLVEASVRLSVSSTTATTVTLAKASTPFATTSRLAFGSIAANSQGTIAVTGTTTGTGITSATDALTTFAPNTYFVVGIQGGIGTFSPTGICQAMWTDTNF